MMGKRNKWMGEDCFGWGDSKGKRVEGGLNFACLQEIQGQERDVRWRGREKTTLGHVSHDKELGVLF